jgi:hypothetical protein
MKDTAYNGYAYSAIVKLSDLEKHKNSKKNWSQIEFKFNNNAKIS